MQSTVDISLEVIQKFNPTDNEIEQLIIKLKNLISTDVIKKPKQMSPEELDVQRFEEWFKSKLIPPMKR